MDTSPFFFVDINTCLGTDPRVLSTSYICPTRQEIDQISKERKFSDLLSHRDKRRRLYHKRREEVLKFGSTVCVPERIECPGTSEVFDVFQVSEEEALARLLVTLSRSLTVPRFADLEDDLTLWPCPDHPCPSWLPFSLSQESDVGYCGCKSMNLVSPFVRADDHFQQRHVHVVGERDGFWLTDDKPSNVIRQAGDIMVGRFLASPDARLSWFDRFIAFFDDLHLDDCRLREMTHHGMVGWFPVDPNLVLFVKHIASTAGNQIMRRDISEKQDRYSLAYWALNSISVGLGMALANQVTAGALIQGQGGAVDIPNWRFLRASYPGIQLVPEEAVPEQALFKERPRFYSDEVFEEDASDVSMEGQSPDVEEEDPILEEPSDCESDLSDVLPPVLLGDSVPSDGVAEQFSPFAPYNPISPVVSETPPQEWPLNCVSPEPYVWECPTSPGFAPTSPVYEPEDEMTPSSPQYSLQQVRSASSSFDWQRINVPVGLDLPTPPSSPEPFGASLPLDHASSEEQAPPATESPDPVAWRQEETRKLRCDRASNQEVVDEICDVALATDEHLNSRPEPIPALGYHARRLSFEEKEVEFVYASATAGDVSHPEVGEGQVSIERSKKPFVYPRSSGFLKGVTVGMVPRVFGSDTATIARTGCIRLSKKLPEASERIQFVYCGTRKFARRITPKHLWFPKHLKAIIQPKFYGVEMNELADDTQTLQDLCKRMKPRARNRLLRTLESVTGLVLEWSDVSSEIRVFVKSDDKVFKDKPRLIQFVPTLAWVRCILKIENILHHIKRGEPWGWRDQYAKWGTDRNPCYKRYVWASGMTQKQLYEAINAFPEARDGEVVFICGDDNTDSESDDDASSYDASQRGVFFDLQGALMVKMGFTEAEVKEILLLHATVRNGGGVRIKIGEEFLPSGAPWTLFMNTVGLVVYHRQKAYLLETACPGNHTQAGELAATLLGLDMKISPSMKYGMNSFWGSEFLKHIFVPVKTGGGHRIFPVQLPSRICKWGCANLASDKACRPDMHKHIGGVALGQVPFLMEPFFTGAFVDAWARYGKEAYVPRWANIVADAPGSELTLPVDVTPEAWADACSEVLCERYGTTRDELENARTLILENGGKFGHYDGGIFTEMVARDYRGEAEVPSQVTGRRKLPIPAAPSRKRSRN